MSPRWVVAGQGGDFEWTAPTRGSGDATVTVKDGNGTTVVAAGTGTLENVNAVLAAGIDAGALSFDLTTSPTLRERGEYLLAGSGARPEHVLVQRHSGSTVYLAQPTLYPHPAAAPFQGTRFSYTLPGASCPSAGDFWRIEWAWSGGPPHVQEFGVAKQAYYNPLRPARLFGFDPTLRLRYPTADWDAVCDFAFAEACRRVTMRGVPIYDYLDADALLDVCQAVARLRASELYGTDYDGLRAYLDERIEALVEQYVGSTPADQDRDGVTSEAERYGQTAWRRVVRK